MQHDFQVLDSELLVDAPIIALRRDQVVMPGGTSASREVVEHFGAVAVVAFREGKIFLVEQYRHSIGQRLMELPAGLLDYVDEEALDCAQRELREEAGLAAKKWSVLLDLATSPGFCDEAVRVFLAQDLLEVERPMLEDEEADMSTSWVDVEAAVAQVFRGEIANAIAVAGILAVYQVLQGGYALRGTNSAFSLRLTRLAARRKAAPGADMKKIARG
ncbi:NUDIX domain-containing protein [Corynebacterium kutscheri]|uniref:ADP-ribose pyrophosphatase n=1 Tax=Corynebacterium kutscheri TaxID=35755 RepID=A0AB38VT50_9CORY|nr:NUDIX hydrolase [Corynebacterium kutscheri]VEH07064.1 ADP-ribose pyrophosphatase [Corynebacterium kutscheri]